MSWHALPTLKRLLDDLQRLGHRQYQDQAACIYNFLNETPVYRAICDSIRGSEPEFDADAWISTKVFKPNRGLHRWPSNERQRMKVLLRLVEQLIVGSGKDHAVPLGMQLSMTGNFDEAVHRLTAEVVGPLVNYILSHVGTASEMLHLLGRFQRQIEWFEQDELFAKYRANTRKGEDVYDRRLRRFLFEEGINYPFSKPRSGSGEADIIAGIESDDPLVCEVKLFDGVDYGPAYVGKGLRQAVRYARDYGKAIGHLVVVNVSEKRLSLPTDGDVGSPPPRIVTEGVTILMALVQGRPRPSASTEGPVQTARIDRDQLVREIGAESDST